MKNETYTRVSCAQLLFLECMSFLTAKMTYSKFIKDTLKKSGKGIFPHGYIKSLDNLKETRLPPNVDDWYSELSKSNMLENDRKEFESLRKKGKTSAQALEIMCLEEEPPLTAAEHLKLLHSQFERAGYLTLHDYCLQYLRQDLIPFCQALEVQSKIFFKEFNSDILHFSYSLPSFSLQRAYEHFAAKGDKLYCCDEKLYGALEEVVAGQNLLFRLLFQSGKTRLKEKKYGDQAKIAQRYLSFDQGLQFGKAMQCGLPVGYPIYASCRDGFVEAYNTPELPHQEHAELIMGFFAWKIGVRDLRTMRNGGEVELFFGDETIRVDGSGNKYHPVTGEFEGKIFFEIDGCFPIHYCKTCPQKFVPTEINPLKRAWNGLPTTNARVFQTDRERITKIRQIFPSAEVMVIQRCQFRREYQSPHGKYYSQFYKFLQKNPTFDVRKTPVKEEEILKMIKNEELFGFARVSVYCPDSLKPTFDQFPLVFHRKLISIDDFNPWHKEQLKKVGALKKPVMEPTSSFGATSLVLPTPLIRFYMEKGLVVHSVSEYWKFQKSLALYDMVKQCCEYRKRADSHDQVLLASIAKAMIVATYGILSLNKEKFYEAKLVTSDKFVEALHEAHFKSAKYLGHLPGTREELYQIKRSHKKIYRDNYKPASAFILGWSKLFCLQLVWDVIHPYFDPRSYEICSSYTDSVSFIISEESFEEWIDKCIIDPKRRAHFKEVVSPATFGLDPISRLNAGAWKIEHSGTAMAAINAKSYCLCTGEEINNVTCRGLPYCCHSELNFSTFTEVLFNNTKAGGTSHNFRLNSECELELQMMYKAALKFYYYKRNILPNTYETETIL